MTADLGGDRIVHVSDLVGVSEVAARLGRSRTTVRAWAIRYPDYPGPVRVIGTRTRVWVWPDVEEWHQRRWPVDRAPNR